MMVLGIETSTRRGSVALAAGGGIVAEAALPEDRTQSAALLPAVEALLAGRGAAPRDIGGIAAGIGPGSFTGVRLGLATARGLALDLGIPIRGICSFDALASRCPAGEGTICTLADAHSHGLYAAVYERRGEGIERVREPFVCRPEELPGRIEGRVFFTGPRLTRMRDALAGLFGGRATFDAGDRFPEASAAALLFESPFALPDDPPDSLGPLYLLPGVRGAGRSA